MNKSDLIETLAERRKMTQKEADLVVNLVLDGMTEALRRGERIEIRGFGSLIVKEYSPYVGRNPKTGEQVHVPAKRLPFFKVGKELKERVDGRTAEGEEAPEVSAESPEPGTEGPTGAAPESATEP